MLLDRLAGKFLEFIIGQLGTRRADDACRFGELVVALAMVESRQQLAFGEVARAPENDEVERLDGNDLAGHFLSTSCRSAAEYSNRLKRPVPRCHRPSPNCRPGRWPDRFAVAP